MKSVTIIKRHLKSLQNMEAKRMNILREDLFIILSLNEDEINVSKKEVVEYIDGLNLSSIL